MTLIDIARGAYARLPPQARGRLGPLVSLVPTGLKYGRTYRRWRDRIAECRENPEIALARQQEALDNVLDAALRHSPYYRDVLGDRFGADVTARDLMAPDLWNRIPVLSSTQVMENRDRMRTVAMNRLDESSTSGSSGAPTRFYLDKARSPIEYAFVHDAWARSGYRPGDARCIFRGTPIDCDGPVAAQYDPALAELRCSVFHLDDEMMAGYVREIRARDIKYLHGYPSALAILATFLRRSEPLDIRGIFPISERFWPHQRDVVAAAFPGAEIVPFYGMSEKVAFAVEVPDMPEVYEFEPIYGYTELLDNDARPVEEPGRIGRIVSTGLLFPGMPFLRYDTGDEAELVALPAPANGYRLRVRRISPRRGTEYLVARNGRLIPVTAIVTNTKFMTAFRELQFIQTVPGEVIVKGVAFEAASGDAQRFVDELHQKAGGDLSARLDLVDTLDLTAKGKRSFVDQRLDLWRRISEQARTAANERPRRRARAKEQVAR